MKYDILILGGGPGGYVAAIRAAQLGKKVAVIEKDRLGGTCLNRGCIPTKVILSTAEFYKNVLRSNEFGLDIPEVKILYDKILERKNAIVNKLVGGVEFIFKKRKIDIIKGKGVITDSNHIKVGDDVYEGEYIIIATGSSPLNLPIFQIDGDRIITSDEALNLVNYPKDIVIIGGGVVGIEFATIFNSFGVKVTIVEMLDNILLPIDGEIRRKLLIKLKKNKIKILTKSKVNEIEKNDDKVIVKLDNGNILSTEMVLVAAGRKMNTEGIGLENININRNGMFIEVNEYMQTSAANIYAIGDITGGIQLAHSASKQGILAVEHIAGIDVKPFSNYLIPACIFSHPEIAYVGMTEEELQSKGIEYKIGRFPFIANGKALGLNEKDGLSKILVDVNDNKILGAHIFGPHASDLIMELALAIQHKMNIEEVADVIHPHPTLSETIMEAAEGILEKMIHGV